MKSKEYRLGNYVQGPLGEIMRIDVLGDLDNPDYIHASNDKAFGQNEFYPIELTPEILEKAGFKIDCVHTHEYKVYGFKTIQTDYVIGDWTEDCKEFEIVSTESDKGVVYNHRCRANIKYVHQLQNLYFSLTGEELPLTL